MGMMRTLAKITREKIGGKVRCFSCDYRGDFAKVTTTYLTGNGGEVEPDDWYYSCPVCGSRDITVNMFVKGGKYNEKI